MMSILFYNIFQEGLTEYLRKIGVQLHFFQVVYQIISINLQRFYFDFFNDDDIRIKGTRVGIETVLADYLNATSPEEIAVRHPVLTLEQVYATITFYLKNQYEIDQYIHRWR